VGAGAYAKGANTVASLNRVQLIGNLGRDPEVRYTLSGTPVVTVSIATSERWKDKETGEPKEATEWHRVVLHGRNAELAAEHLATGSQVYVEGALSTRKWTDAHNVERCTTEIRAFEIKFLGGRRKDNGGGNGAPATAASPGVRRGAKRAAAPAAKATAAAPAGGLETEWDDLPL
jgi:single-strand DNA-binding protein